MRARTNEQTEQTRFEALIKHLQACGQLAAPLSRDVREMIESMQNAANPRSMGVWLRAV